MKRTERGETGVCASPKKVEFLFCLKGYWMNESEKNCLLTNDIPLWDGVY